MSEDIELIRESSEATPAWLTRVLHGSGALPTSATVTDVRAEQFAQGSGLLSELFRLTPTYEGGHGPATLVLKLPTSEPSMRGVADALGLYARELRFYRELAPTAPFETAACHVALADGTGTTTDFVLVLEDLAHRTPLDQVVGCDWEQANAVIDRLADFHAQWWGHDRLPELATTFLPAANPMYVAVLPQLYGPGWVVAREVAADLLTDDLRAFGDRWADLCGAMLEAIMEPTTLIHGDWRSDNLFLDGDRLTVIDFQIVGTATGVSDLAYFVSQSLEPEVSHGRNRELCDGYVRRMADRGVELEPEQAWRQYRLALCFCLTYPVTVFQSWDDLPDRGRDLVRSMLRRALAAIHDADALAVLPA
ncbi:MAG TPA: phosphotransferase [Acidimicrobiales bacterium]|nr:phosphotransferase [Acidimicrobiales bacterium]